MRGFFSLIILTASLPLSAWGLDLGSHVQLHGYGSIIYGETDGNQFATGDEDGEIENLNFALNLNAELHPRFRLVVQVAAEQTFTRDDLDVDLDYLFGAWQFVESAELLFGRVKQPFGLYTEIIDVGTLRPFLQAPQGLYGPTAFISKSFDGVGLSGETHWGGWGLEYSIYAGELLTEGSAPPFQALILDPTAPIDPDADFAVEFDVSDVLGARLNLHLPIPGLLLGVSAYGGDAEATGAAALVSGDALTTGGHGEYQTDRWSIRSEFVRFETDRLVQETAYFEIARRFGPHWQIAARWEDWEAIPDAEALLPDFPPGLPPGIPPGLPPGIPPGLPPGIPPGFPMGIPPLVEQLLEHRDLALAVNYWFNPRMVLKLNVHRMTGNRLAFPTDPETLEQLRRGAPLEDETEVVEFGFQASF